MPKFQSKPLTLSLFQSANNDLSQLKNDSDLSGKKAKTKNETAQFSFPETFRSADLIKVTNGSSNF